MRHRQVTLEEANAKATQLNIMFMETSAKAGHNVKSLFKKIAMSLVGMEKENEQTEAQNTSMCQHPTCYPCTHKRSYRDRRYITTTERDSRRISVSVLSSFRRDRAYHTPSCFAHSCMYFLTVYTLSESPILFAARNVVVHKREQQSPGITTAHIRYKCDTSMMSIVHYNSYLPIFRVHPDVRPTPIRGSWCCRPLLDGYRYTGPKPRPSASFLPPSPRQTQCRPVQHRGQAAPSTWAGTLTEV